MFRIIHPICLLPLLAAQTVWAACTGVNMLDELRVQDAAGVQAMFDRAHRVPNSQGLVWSIERPGTEPSVLFGTFHSGDAVATVPQAVWQALDTARVAVFELSQDEQAALQERAASDLNFTLDMSAPPLLSTLNEKQRAALEAAFKARGLPIQAAEQMRPWLLASLLGFPACHLRASAQGVEVLDNVLAKRAMDNAIKVEGLETYEQALAGFSGLNRDTIIKMLVVDDSFVQREEDLFRTTAELYVAGETAAINEFSIWMAERLDLGFDARALNRRLMQSLLDGRNQAWMEGLQQHLQGGNAFVAVGALHLPGELGLIELLRAQGYTLRRID